ncbi:hypothetical protein FRC03_010899 [Tulasnella sp. 419]|nr:hypothetical protein FRC03_010899 [Tulasnella sp. 419]
MDILGTVTTAIELGSAVKAILDQVDENRSESAFLCTDIVEYLRRVEDFLGQRNLNTSVGLRDELSEFENELRTILRYQDDLCKRNGSGSIAKLRELFNASDIKDRLAVLNRKVQRCRDNLQLSSTMRADSEITSMNAQLVAMREGQEAISRQLQVMMETLIPGATPLRMAELDRIERSIQEQIGLSRNDSPSEQGLTSLRDNNPSKAVLSIKSGRNSLRSFSSSVIDNAFLKRRVKELSHILPQYCDRGIKQRDFIWSNPFRELLFCKNQARSHRTRKDTIQETMRIITTLRSGRKMSSMDAARDLLGLALALGDLGMMEESSTIYEWGVHVCCRISMSGNSRISCQLGKFLYDLFSHLCLRRQFGDAQRVMEEAIAIRGQLERKNQAAFVVRMCRTLCGVLSVVEDCDTRNKAVKELVTIYRCVRTMRSDRSHSQLRLCLESLILHLHGAPWCKEAIGLFHRVIEVYQDISENNLEDRHSILVQHLLDIEQLFSRRGHFVNGIRVMEYLIEFCRMFVVINPFEHLHLLILPLSRLESRLYTLGSYEEALQVQWAVVELMASRKLYGGLNPAQRLAPSLDIETAKQNAEALKKYLEMYHGPYPKLLSGGFKVERCFQDLVNRGLEYQLRCSSMM